MLLMACGFIYSMFLIKNQWIHNYEFHCVSNSFSEHENHGLIMEIVKRYDFEIIDNNLHRTILTAKGKTSTLSIGSILTFVYSNNEILINSRPTIGNFSIWPFYRTDLNTVLTELEKTSLGSHQRLNWAIHPSHPGFSLLLNSLITRSPCNSNTSPIRRSPLHS